MRVSVKILRFFLLVYSPLIFLSCGEKIPRWIESPYEGFNPAYYIVGVGSGANKNEADASARAEIIKQIKVNIKEIVEGKIESSSTFGYDEKDKDKSWIVEKIRKYAETEAEGILEGAIIKERYFDRKREIWYSLAILNKSEFAKKLKSEISEKDSEILLKIKNLQDTRDASYITSKISEIERAIEELKSKLLLIQTLGERTIKIASDEFVNRIKEMLKRAKMMIKGEEKFSNIIAPIELKIKLTDENGLPIQNVPMKVEIKTPIGERVIIDIITDQNGEAKVLHNVFLKPGENDIRVIPNLPYMDGVMEVFKIWISYEKPVIVRSKYDVLKENMKRCLHKEGIKTFEDDKIQKDDKIREVEGSTIIIQGDIYYDEVYTGKDFRGDNLIIAQSTLAIRAETEDGFVLFEKVISEKGIGKSSEEAKEKAIKRAITKICGVQPQDISEITEREKKEISEKEFRKVEAEKGYKVRIISPENGFITEQGKIEVVVEVPRKPGYLKINGEVVASISGDRMRLLTARLLTAREVEKDNIVVEREKDDIGKDRKSDYEKNLYVKKEVYITQGENKIYAEFVSEDGKEISSDTIFVFRKGGSQKKSYIIAVGISKYTDEKLNLKFADKDAETFAESMAKAIQNSEKIVIKNEEATREKIIKEILSIAERIKEGDRVIIFFAGHGLKHKITGTYYFATFDTTEQNIPERALVWADINEIIRYIVKSGGIPIIFLDTCYSGTQSIPTDLANQLTQYENIFIISSSSPGELSFESDELKQGLFTYAILKGISEGDLNQDRKITVAEFFSFISDKVKEFSEGKQNPFFRSSGRDIPLIVAP